jgi:hypothetical protein
VIGVRGETMGPRARRRLIRAVGGVAAVIAAVVIAFFLSTRSSGHASRNASTTTIKNGERVVKGVTEGRAWTDTYGPKSNERYALNNQRVIFGMSPAKVRSIIGSPEKIAGSCWQYRLDETISMSGQTDTYNAQRLCFSYGVYNIQYSQTDGAWRDGRGNAIPAPTH